MGGFFTIPLWRELLQVGTGKLAYDNCGPLSLQKKSKVEEGKKLRKEV